MPRSRPGCEKPGWRPVEMQNWRIHLKFDPLPSLLASRDEVLLYHVRRDLLGEDAGPVHFLWELLANQYAQPLEPNWTW